MQGIEGMEIVESEVAERESEVQVKTKGRRNKRMRSFPWRLVLYENIDQK